ncbi:MAG: hypothetical protein ABIN80_24690 [Dyadobacter sp.]|uniref:hypothetical protein n=1 Tax=Dyadobacter sp. TaxID=1914288 RepID=UPI0032669F99
MKLVQKLPAILAIACVMMMSSCSKDDVQTPEPQAAVSNSHSGLKTNAGEVVGHPFFPSTTDAIVNFDSYPRYWERSVLQQDNLVAYPTGSSTRTSLWGHWYEDCQWIKPLPPVPSNLTANSMVTVRSFTSIAAETQKRSYVHTTIQNLIPGKAYTATFYVASTITNRILSVNTKNVYAKSAEIKLLQSNSGTVNVNVDLTGKEAVWVKKTVTFTPQTDHAKFSFSGLAQPGNVYSYIHLFVDVNAVKEALQVTPIQL